MLVEARKPCALTLPSRGLAPAGFACLRKPLMSNVRRREQQGGGLWPGRVGRAPEGHRLAVRFRADGANASVGQPHEGTSTVLKREVGSSGLSFALSRSFEATSAALLRREPDLRVVSKI